MMNEKKKKNLGVELTEISFVAEFSLFTGEVCCHLNLLISLNPNITQSLSNNFNCAIKIA